MSGQLRRRDDPARQSIALATARRVASRLVRLYFRIDIRGLEHLPTSGGVLISSSSCPLAGLPPPAMIRGSS